MFFLYWWISCQIATIGLAADENPFGVVIGGIMYELLLLLTSILCLNCLFFVPNKPSHGS